MEHEEMLLLSLSGFKPVFRRFFLSERPQAAAFPVLQGAVSFIVQPPLDGRAVSEWIYLVKDADVEYSHCTTVVREGDCEYVWTAGQLCRHDDPELQSREILETYSKTLRAQGMTLAENCVRTWFFVHDIDSNYAAMVKARRENFVSEGLTRDTHYIASTGICGTPCPEGSIVQMDAVAMKGNFKQKYLYAPTHLNPTYEYGVTFERGVKVESAGRSTVFISGTASINNRGEVVHVGDVLAQTGRMLENVEVLLDEAGTSWKDVKMALVYLRNAEDYAGVAPVIAERLPGVPYVILLAPVCRPDWLIEMECIAASEA